MGSKPFSQDPVFLPPQALEWQQPLWAWRGLLCEKENRVAQVPYSLHLHNHTHGQRHCHGKFSISETGVSVMGISLDCQSDFWEVGWK